MGYTLFDFLNCKVSNTSATPVPIVNLRSLVVESAKFISRAGAWFIALFGRPGSKAIDLAVLTHLLS